MWFRKTVYLFGIVFLFMPQILFAETVSARIAAVTPMALNSQINAYYFHFITKEIIPACGNKQTFVLTGYNELVVKSKYIMLLLALDSQGIISFTPQLIDPNTLPPGFSLRPNTCGAKLNVIYAP